jgi:hypothetical protein
VTPGQRIWQGRFEALIALATPALDAMLTVGDRASRLVTREDRDYYPIRPPSEAFELDAAREQAGRHKRSATVD